MVVTVQTDGAVVIVNVIGYCSCNGPAYSLHCKIICSGVAMEAEAVNVRMDVVAGIGLAD